MNLNITTKKGAAVPEDLIGLFFEDINYAADGGLHAEMIENRSFEFLKAMGNWDKDYWTEYDGLYGWKPYPEGCALTMRTVMGSPVSEENPHYLRVEAKEPLCSFTNKAYDGIYLEKDKSYRVSFYARMTHYRGNLSVSVQKEGRVYAHADISCIHTPEDTWRKWIRYEAVLTAEETVRHADFVLTLADPGVVEFDFISMIPCDAVYGVFRKDLADLLRDMRPAFLRFPGGCIIEGNTLSNRYRFKDTLKPAEHRKHNWSRWAVHNANEENGYVSPYAYYNQTLGIGYYEYFLLCEYIGAKPLPVLNVGLACQYQSHELVPVDSPEFQEYIQDALDLIEFANGNVSTRWGAVRAAMGHPEPFHMELMGIGNEQWETDQVDFFERYRRFEAAIHAAAPDMKLIGSAGPDLDSDRYRSAWNFYHAEGEKNPAFAYAVDEHSYSHPDWMFQNTDYYDSYPRSVKVFFGEYAAHPYQGHNFNSPKDNTLYGALAEAAFLTGIERNADVVILASYAPLLAREGYAQWGPDMIWFDDEKAYGTPSYYVQKMFGRNQGTVMLDLEGQEKTLADRNLFVSASLEENSGELIIKIVNRNADTEEVSLNLPEEWTVEGGAAEILTGEQTDAYNSIEAPEKITPHRESVGAGQNTFLLPGSSFSVIRLKLKSEKA